MFPAVSIDDGGAEIPISSYVDDSFALTSSFLIRKFLLSKTITIMIRKAVTPLTIIKITINIVAVKITATPDPLLPWSPETVNNVFCNNLSDSHSGIIKMTGSDIGPFPSTLVANTVIDTPPLENRQDKDGFIFSVCVQTSPLQADTGIVSVPQV